MGLLNNLWSQADFWDKEENKRQAQAVAKPMPARAPQPQQNVIQRAAPTGLRAGLGVAVATLPGANTARAAYKLLNRTKPGKAVLAGAQRSAIGTGQALSGLYDLATPGTGTNRISKTLDVQAKQVDQSVKRQKLNPVLYKGGQLGGDIATGLGAGGVTKWAGKGLVKAAPVLGNVPKAATAIEQGVNKVVAPLAKSNFAGRVAGKAISNIANPKYQGVNALYTAQQIGKEASQGKKITPQRVATDAAVGGVAFPAAGALGGEALRTVARPVVKAARNAHLIRPTNLNDTEVARLSTFVDNRGTNGMTEEVYNRGIAAAQKAGLNPYDVSAMDRVIGDHMTYNTRALERQQRMADVKERLKPKPLNENGFIAGPLALDFSKAKAAGQVFKGVDGKPRFEVSDHNATSQKLNSAYKYGMPQKLGDVLDHPDLYANYPELRGLDLHVNKNMTGFKAEFNPDTNSITLNANQIGPDGRLTHDGLGSALHEVQHYIQEKEGFGSGGTPVSRNYAAENASIKRGLADVNNQLNTLAPNDPLIAKLRKKRDNLIEQLSQTQDQYGNVFTPHGQYQKLAGEAEARAVQARMNMPMSERYVKPEATKHADYVGAHQAPIRDAENYHAPSSDVTGGAGMFPDDIYTDPRAYSYYGHGGDAKTVAMDKKSIEIIRSLKGKPDAEVTMYRAVPKGKANDINAGDWVTLNKDYAQQHNLSQFDGKGTILEKKVKADELYTDGNSIHEFGYDPRPAPRSTFYDSLDVPKEDLIIRNEGGKAMSVEKPKTPTSQLAANTQPPISDPMQQVFDQNPMLPGNTRRPDLVTTRPQPTPGARVPEVPQTLDTPQPQKPSLKTSELVKSSPSVNSTPELHPAQKQFIQEYADMLRNMEKDARGGDLVPDGNGGYIRTSSHSQFHRNYYAENKRAPTKADWFDEAKRQLESGKGAYGASDEYRKLADPEVQSLLGQVPEKQLTPLEQNKINAKNLRQEVIDYKNTLTPVKSKGGEVKIPVRKVTQEGDVVTKTNINPNIKAKTERYSLNDRGELVPDTNGAYHIFKDAEGHVTDFRIGDKVYPVSVLGDLSTVNGKGSALASMRRNFDRGFDPATSQKVNNFVVDHQQHAVTQMVERQKQFNDGMKKLADDLGISFGIGRRKAQKVSAAIQDFGEGKITKDQLVSTWGKDYAEKIVNADKWFRKNYNDLLDEANATLTKHGYDPIPKRKNYYTHFQDPSMWSKVGLKMEEFKNWASPTGQDAMGISTRDRISNGLAGQSEFLTPNKRFNPFAQQRKGDTHTSDAFQAFERYLNPTLNNIYMTPSITRARVVTRMIQEEADLAKKDAKHILVQTREWANRLAGKSNRFDRPAIDSDWGSKALNVSGWLQRRAGANTIVGNVATAVKQPIVLAQTVGKFGYKNTLVAIGQEMSSAHAANAAIRQSEFMRRRYTNLAPITRGKTARAADIASTPLKVVEETSARITWNAAYNDAVEQGLKGKAAIHAADVAAEKTLAGRALGERPELFESKAAGLVTMYQLEVANYIQQVGREMTPKQVIRTFTAAYALNLVLQQLTGSQIGFNPIGAGVDTLREVNKNEKSGSDKAKAIGQRWAGEVLDNTPIVTPVLNTVIGDKNMKKLTGKDSQVGKFGVSSPATTLWNNPAYLALPFGGGQLKKTYQGIKAVSDGKLVDKKGDTTVDIPRTPGNYLKGAIFGKSAINEVNGYYNNIGKKKVDQKAVPNQIDSKAGKMGGINNGQIMPSAGATGFGTLDTKEALKAGFTTKLGKEMLAQKPDQIKDWARQSPEKTAIYKDYLAAKKRLSPSVSNSENYSDSDLSVKLTENSLQDSGKQRWYKNFDKGSQSSYDFGQTEIKPKDWQDLPKNNKVASMAVDLRQRLSKAKNELEKNDLKKEFLVKAYKTAAGDAGDIMFNGSKYSVSQKMWAVDNGYVSKSDLDAAIKIDNMLIEKGLSSTPSISKQIRSKYGYATPKSSTSGSGGSKSSRTGKRTKLTPFVIPTYSTTNRKMRSLLKSTRAKA